MPSLRGLGRKEKNRAKLFQALAVIGAISAVAIGLVIVGHVLTPPPTDPDTGCPIGDPVPIAHTIILIDETDQLSPSELDYARSLVRTEYAWLPVGGRLTVRNITADPYASHDVSICRMRDGKSGNGLTVTPEFLQQQFDKVAGAQIERLLADLAHAKPQDASPILETVSEARRRPDFGKEVIDRRLIIHSDLAQHSDDFSQYGARKVDLPSALGLFGADFSGVKVRLHYIRRRALANMQRSAAHSRFWTNYFERQGASDVVIGHDLNMEKDRSLPTIIYRAPQRSPGEAIQ